MVSTYFLIIIILLQGIFQIDNFLPKLKKAKPWIVFVLLIALAVVSFINENSKETEAKNTIKESNLFILNGIGDAIGKYKLGYDSVTKQFYQLQKLIKDSSNRKTTVIQGDNPNINFTPDNGITVDSFTNDFIRVHVILRSYSAPSILKYSTMHVLVSNKTSDSFYLALKYYNSQPIGGKNLGIAKSFAIKKEVDISGHYLKHVKTIIILVKGSYTDSYGKNPQPLNSIGLYDLTSREFGIVISPFDDSVRVFLKKKGIIK